MRLNKLEAGDRGFITGLGRDFDFTVVLVGPCGVMVKYDKRKVDNDFEAVGKDGETTVVRFTRPPKAIQISGTAEVTKLPRK